MAFKHSFNPSDTYFKHMKDFNAFLYKIDGDKCPVFFAHGQNKGAMIHSNEWLKNIYENEKKGSLEVSFDAGHWLMVEKADEFNKKLLDWLHQTDKSKK